MCDAHRAAQSAAALGRRCEGHQWPGGTSLVGGGTWVTLTLQLEFPCGKHSFFLKITTTEGANSVTDIHVLSSVQL